MANRQRYRMVSAVTWGARAIGLILLALAILSLPQLKLLSGSVAVGIGIASAAALAVAAVLWLGAVEAAAHLFKHYLSRN